MKRFVKNNILGILIGLVIAGGIGIVYATTILARDIAYKNTNVEDALDDLYAKAPKKICELKSGTANTVSAKYECDPGDGVKRNFYILEVRDKEVDLIMDRNITQGTSTTTMTWMNAMKYVDSNNLKTTWSNVLNVDLPKAQVIANAVGNTTWNMEDKDYDGWFYFDKNGSSYGQTQVANDSNLSNYRWLFNYTRECQTYGCDAATSLGSTEAYGYLTRDIVAQQKDSTGRAWRVARNGTLSGTPVSNDTYYGVRPVITVLKSNLYEAE